MFYGSESWCMKLGNERKLRVLGTKVFSKIFGLKLNAITSNLRAPELQRLYGLFHFIAVMKSRPLRIEGYIARMGKTVH